MTETKKSKKALQYKTREIFDVPPEYPHLVIIGLDTKDTAATHDRAERRLL